LFDRIRRGIELGYSEKETQEGRGYRLQIPKEKTLVDLNSSINVVKHAGRVAVIGYCWGGTLAYLAACELPVACAVLVLRRADQGSPGEVATPAGHVPLRRKGSLHSPADIEKIRAADPNGEFICTPPTMVSTAMSAPRMTRRARSLAHERTLAFLERKWTTRKWRANDQAPGRKALERARLHRGRLGRRRFGHDTEIRNPCKR
jgi:carboxymethylenebutenolidase